jgi:hypothetical protein
MQQVSPTFVRPTVNQPKRNPMSTTIEATYDGQVFRPTSLVPLAPNTTVRLTIEALALGTAEPVAQSYPEADFHTAVEYDWADSLYEVDRALANFRFRLGKVTITGGAIAALADADERAAAFLARHVRGDWGEYGHCDATPLTAEERRRGCAVTDNSGKINKCNLLSRRGRIMSEYQTRRGIRLWVITCLDLGGGTTVLTPEEY